MASTYGMYREGKYYEQYKNDSLNKSELAKLAGVTRPTAYKYISLLEGEKDE